MPGIAQILLDIFIIFVAAKLGGEAFERMRQPAVVGELLAGVLIGPHALGLIGRPDAALVAAFQTPVMAEEALHIVYEVLAEIGVIILLFFVGLETRLEDLLGAGKRAALVAVLGIVVPFLLGYLLVASLGYTGLTAVIVGTAMVATSVGITARVLADLGGLATTEARIILGAAVVDDILGMILLAAVAGVGAGNASWAQIALIVVEALAFTGFVVLVGARVIRRYDAHLDDLRLHNGPFVAAIVVCLGLAALAGYVGLAAIIGAFLAGITFSESRQREDIVRHTRPVYDFLVPFFFVVTGAQVDPRVFLDGNVMGVAASATTLAIAGKLIGCGAGAWGTGWRSMLRIGVGMVPRGEVGLIVAALGRSMQVLPDNLFSVIVFMSIATTLVAPPALNVLFRPSGAD